MLDTRKLKRDAFVWLVVATGIAALLVVPEVSKASPLSVLLADQAATGPIDRVLLGIGRSAEAWTATGQKYSRLVFAPLAMIHLIWTGIENATAGGSDLRSAMGRWTRELLILGICWELIENGPELAKQIVDFLRAAGTEASASAPYTPQKVLDDAVKMATENATANMASAALFGDFAGIFFLAFAFLVGVLLGLMMLAELWAQVTIGLGAIVLGFGGSVMTRPLVSGYFRAAVGAGMKLYVMRFLQSTSLAHLQSWVDEASASNHVGLEVLLTMFVSIVVLAIMIATAPGLVQQLMGGGIATAGMAIAGLAGVATLRGGLMTAAGHVGAALKGGAAAVSAASSTAGSAAGVGGSGASLLSGAGGPMPASGSGGGGAASAATGGGGTVGAEGKGAGAAVSAGGVGSESASGGSSRSSSGTSEAGGGGSGGGGSGGGGGGATGGAAGASGGGAGAAASSSGGGDSTTHGQRESKSAEKEGAGGTGGGGSEDGARAPRHDSSDGASARHEAEAGGGGEAARSAFGSASGSDGANHGSVAGAGTTVGTATAPGVAPSGGVGAFVAGSGSPSSSASPGMGGAAASSGSPTSTPKATDARSSSGGGLPSVVRGKAVNFGGGGGESSAAGARSVAGTSSGDVSPSQVVSGSPVSVASTGGGGGAASGGAAAPRSAPAAAQAQRPRAPAGQTSVSRALEGARGESERRRG